MDSWEAAVVAGILSDPTHPLYVDAVCAFNNNLAEVSGTIYDGLNEHGVAALACVSAELQAELNDIAGIEANFALLTGDPLAPQGDLDGDGVLNIEEYLRSAPGEARARITWRRCWIPR